LNCVVSDSPPVIESFAGIATGLTGSLAHVRINRLADGAFVWPADLPEHVAGRPLTVAANVLAHGTGALNIDATRIGSGAMKWETPRGGIWATDSDASARLVENDLGRWPANLIHDGSDEVLACFPETTSGSGERGGNNRRGLRGNAAPAKTEHNRDGDTGSAARFFYCAKSSRSERGEGNDHPTVKPVELMRWLVRLVTPPGGHVLDPFAGSGTTGIAADIEQMRATLIEQDPAYAEIARQRLLSEAGLFALAAE
jgi:site-specific DNA-methyltransferase (adenine-specific)